MLQHYSHPNQDLIYAALFKAYLNGDSCTSLITRAAALVGNPILLMNQEYQILEHSNLEEITDAYWLKPLQNHVPQRNFSGESGDYGTSSSYFERRL